MTGRVIQGVLMLVRRKGLLALIIALGLGAVRSFAAPAVPQSPGLEHTLIASYTPGAKLAVTARSRGEVDWVTLYYRTPGLKAFQARPMAKAVDAVAYACELDTSTLAGEGFEYYVEAEKGDRKVAVPAGGAAEPARVKPEAAEQAAFPRTSLPPRPRKPSSSCPCTPTGACSGLSGRMFPALLRQPRPETATFRSGSSPVRLESSACGSTPTSA
jgi:hypothetical protein